MPELNWIGKNHVLQLDRQVPYRMIHCDSGLSIGDAGEGNLLIEGDNLEALKALLPYYAGKVKCIYIDPPYNTGNEHWVYNDNVNAPEMRAWLGKEVGDEMSDRARDDKWLCMMYPRLKLLSQLLRDDGSIFISIDDNEFANLRLLMDEIFGADNFVASVIWQKRTSPDARSVLGAAHDYILVYAKSIFQIDLNKIPMSLERAKEYKNPDNDARGSWVSVDLTGQTGHATASQFYTITTPGGHKFPPPNGRCWALNESTFIKLASEERIWFGKKGDARPRLKRYLSEAEGSTTWTWWPNSEVGHNQEATKELNDIIGVTGLFETPKPSRLIKRLVQLATNPNDLVLDSFAGSGTTGHAVMQVNAEDGGNRHFILIEMDREICRNVTAERLKRVIQNNGGGLLPQGGFRYCTLDEPLFDAEGRISPDVMFGDLAHHIFFTETGEPLPVRVDGSSPFIGCVNNIAYYLLWKGNEEEALLDMDALHTLPPHNGAKIVYADGCLLSQERLNKMGIVFKQVPYEVKVR